jgi:hypothetical protein
MNEFVQSAVILLGELTIISLVISKLSEVIKLFISELNDIITKIKKFQINIKK